MLSFFYSKNLEGGLGAMPPSKLSRGSGLGINPPPSLPPTPLIWSLALTFLLFIIILLIIVYHIYSHGRKSRKLYAVTIKRTKPDYASYVKKGLIHYVT